MPKLNFDGSQNFTLLKRLPHTRWVFAMTGGRLAFAMMVVRGTGIRVTARWGVSDNSGDGGVRMCIQVRGRGAVAVR